MKWWFSPKEAHNEETPEPQSQVRAEVHTSLVINVLYHHFQNEQRFHVLDLGPALNENIEFFSQFTCKLYIEDFYQTLSAFDYLSSEDGFQYDAVFEYLLPFRRDVRFDFVLSWDLINYLEREEFTQLVRHISRFCHRNTLILCLVSTQKHIPEQPTRFKIVDQENLLYETRSGVLRPGPKYQQTDLNQLLPGFRVCNSFLMRNGIKEYLFIPK